MRPRRAALVVAVTLICAVALVLLAPGCGAARSVRDRAVGKPAPTVTSTPTPVPTPTPALPPNPQGLHRWDTLPVHYCIDDASRGYVANGEFTRLVQRAFATWGVPTVDDGPCRGSNVQDDRTNEIGWGTPPAASPRRAGITEAGVTLTTYSECTSGCASDDRVKLVEADILIESEPPAPVRNETCLYSTLLHETGHFLGLDHLPPPAVMAAETSRCPTQLTATDREAVRERYGSRASPQ